MILAADEAERRAALVGFREELADQAAVVRRVAAEAMSVRPPSAE